MTSEKNDVKNDVKRHTNETCVIGYAIVRIFFYSSLN